MSHRIKIVHISVQNIDLDLIGKATDFYQKDHDVIFTFKHYFSSDIDEDPLKMAELNEDLKDADFLFIRYLYVPRRFKRLDRVERLVKESGINTFMHTPNPEISDIYRHYFHGSDDDYSIFNILLENHALENEIEIVKHLGNLLADQNDEIVLPEMPESHGIYHAGEFPDAETYLESLDRVKPTVGILFRSYIKENYTLEHMDDLISALEERGLQTIPVYFPGKSRRGKESFNSENVVRRYFMGGTESRIDVMIVMSPFSLVINASDEPGLTSDVDCNFLKRLTDVPVIQAMSVGPEFLNYKDMKAGLKAKDVVSFVAWPEIDGQIISVPVVYTKGEKGKEQTMVSIPERIDHLARLAFNWASLRKKKPKDRKIALLVYQKRFDNGRLGAASGIDSMESVARILARLKEEGYSVGDVPSSGREMLDRMLSGVTNDFSNNTDEFIREHAAGSLTNEQYLKRFNSLSDYNKDHIREFWGEPPGNVCTCGSDMMMPGVIMGNVLVGIQPPRSWESNAERLYHDPILPPQHQYVAYYQWIRDVFKADAVIHLGTHGSLEWLPGKNTALSPYCYPDLVLDSLPNIYPYIIDNPGEGIQAKRRSEAVLIGHAAPTMVRSELYDSLEELDSLVHMYLDLESTMPGTDHSELLEQIKAKLEGTTLMEQMPLDLEDPKNSIPELEDRLEEIKDTLIPIGLHIFGDVPDAEETKNIVESCLRVSGPQCESLRDCIAAAKGITGLDYDVEPIEELCHELISRIAETNYSEDRIEQTVLDVIGVQSPRINEILRYVCRTLVPNIRRTDDEMNSLITALDGRYVIPGPPGEVSRGNMEALPTGRNIYGIDPETLPTPVSWKNGVRMADTMLERYVEENGSYPHSIGFIIWATDTMKTGGDDVAYILWLMGVRPVWMGNGHIKCLEVVPLEELKRPRIDVSVRITGLFRDSFPNLIKMIGDAVSLIADLEESEEENYLAANLRSEIVDQMEQGIDAKRARELSMVRVFGGMSGSYGAGVNHAIENKDWKDVNDLSQMYVTWGGCGFTADGREIRMEKTFIKKFSTVDVAIKNMPDRQMDVFTGDDVYGYLGGLSALAKANAGRDLKLYVGDGADPNRPKVRTATEECGHVMRAKILNPRYIEGLKKHGFQGVTELARTAEYMKGWDAVSGSIEDWMFDDFADMVMKEENMEWMNDENPFSLMEILEHLNECIDRGLWNADDDMIERLKEAYLEVESRLEEVTDR
ncbi:cobaltochelatase CobN [methanogenic archaeon mixed culture ISO4-G1]|nr:cobaltochelatase CobN [methanogenic archaeon mixed culture ISO4-G1]